MSELYKQSQLMLTQLEKALVQGHGEWGLQRLRQEMMAHLRATFLQEFNAFLNKQSDKGEVEKNSDNWEVALKEYVKARTSHLARDDGWEGVAILHKRECKGNYAAEREKYTTIANMCYEEWGLGSHDRMERNGQIYGPCVRDFVSKGTHTWVVNAAWLLGHLHSMHRFIQVVPVTEDNVERGSKKGQLGALYYEVTLIELAGMKVFREGKGVWKEWVPSDKVIETELDDLTKEQAPMKPQKLEENIPLSEVVAATESMRNNGKGKLLPRYKTGLDKWNKPILPDYDKEEMEKDKAPKGVDKKDGTQLEMPPNLVITWNNLLAEIRQEQKLMPLVQQDSVRNKLR